jgi:hypothetical protein
VNKLDRVGSDFDRCVAMIRARLGANAVPLQLPIGAEDKFAGVVDLLEETAIYWDDASLGASFETRAVPDELREAAHSGREAVIEAVADFDEALTARYLEGEPISADQVRKALREATLHLKVVPVLCGAAFKNKGIQPLLDAIVHYLPSPLDVPPVEGTHPKTGEVQQRKADDNEPFAALVFKLMTDKHVGHLTYLRVYSGHAEPGQQLINASTGRKERIGRLLQMHANKREEIEEIGAGDIAAVVGFKAGAHRRHARRLPQADRARVAALPRARPLDRDRAEDAGRHGPARAVARSARAGGPVVPAHDRRGDRPDDHLRDGRAPPRDHHRPARARVRRRGERRQAAGRLQGDDHAHRARRGPLHQADRWLGRLRRSCSSRSVPASRARASRSRTRSRARTCPASSCPRSSAAARRRPRAARSRAIRWSTSR